MQPWREGNPAGAHGCIWTGVRVRACVPTGRLGPLPVDGKDPPRQIPPAPLLRCPRSPPPAPPTASRLSWPPPARDKGRGRLAPRVAGAQPVTAAARPGCSRPASPQQEPHPAPRVTCPLGPRCGLGETPGPGWQGAPSEAQAPTSPSALSRTVRKLSPVPQLFWLFHTSVEGGLWTTPAPAAHTWGHGRTSPSILAPGPGPHTSSQFLAPAPWVPLTEDSCQGTEDTEVQWPRALMSANAG